MGDRNRNAAPSPMVPSQDPDKGNAIKHTKIIGTLGPASSDEDTLRKLILAGMDIARLNFSHGDHAMHLKNIELVRRISTELGKPVGILQDLQGPKIRVGKLIGDSNEIASGTELTLIYGTQQTELGTIPIDYRGLVHDVRVGDRVMMDDGLLILEVTKLEKDSVKIKVLEGGILKNRKGVNFPDSKLSLPALTEKDSKDLLFGIAHHIDFVALSFVQDPADVRQIKSMIRALGSDVPVVAKIEKLPAMELIDEIAALSDALMVARGDLGVEGGVERVPAFQKTIIQAAEKYGKPVIIATQMLESMIENPDATLAEVADVANGVLDGADCLMLSAEVASGKFPVKAVERMNSVIREVESWKFRQPPRLDINLFADDNRSWEAHESIAVAACEAALTSNARAIVCLTLTGSIAKSIARWRPNTAIFAVSPRIDVIKRLAMVWGVYGVVNPSFYDTDILIEELPDLLKKLRIVTSGDTVVITAGIPMREMCPTNMIKINRIS